MTGLAALAERVPADVLVTLPVLLPLLAAAIAIGVGRRYRIQRTVSLTTLAVVLADAVLLLARVDAGDQTLVVDLGGWEAPIGITLVADRLAALLLVVSAVVLLAVVVFAVGQGIADGDRQPVAVFHPCYLVLAAGIAHAFVTGDLFNLFVAFEVVLVSSYVLLTLTGEAPQVRSGMTYVVVSLLSSMLFVTAVALIYAATGTVNFADLADRLAELPEGVRTALGVTLLLVFSVKAAVFPLFAWLPDSYPTAPAPVTAVFAGLLTKVGVYAIIRTQTLLFPGEGPSGLLIWAGVLTMVVGILGALAQEDLKRLLSFTLISHIGYMLFGLGLATAAGLAGAVVYVVHHIAVQTTLFLAAGLVERRAGSCSLSEVSGLVRVTPLVAVLYLLPALSLAGVPPFSGFVAKLGLLQAGVAEGGWLAMVGVAAALVTALLTLYAVVVAWIRAFWGEVRLDFDEPHDDTRDQPHDAARDESDAGSPDDRRPQDRAHGSARTLLPRTMVAAAVAAVVGVVALTPAAGALYGVGNRAALELMSPEQYREAVLGPDGVADVPGGDVTSATQGDS